MDKERLLDYADCTLCPRGCHADRRAGQGFCRCTDKMKAARAALHYWEEPCISGTKGSGAVFFSGCTLRCCFCQNDKISRGGFGKELTPKALADIFLRLQEKGAHNINLVTATQYLPSIISALDMVKGKLLIPVVYNSGGYEKKEILNILKDYIDIYLPDLKYFDTELSARYSKAPDYFAAASEAVLMMAEQKGSLMFNEEGILQKGVIIRHMVLPSCYRDSIKILHWIKDNLKSGSFLLSLLSQYTPYGRSEYPEINRRLTTYEYEKVLNEAAELGLTDGYMQEKSSAKEEYTPPFDFEGL